MNMLKAKENPAQSQGHGFHDNQSISSIRVISHTTKYRIGKVVKNTILSMFL